MLANGLAPSTLNRLDAAPTFSACVPRDAWRQKTRAPPSECKSRVTRHARTHEQSQGIDTRTGAHTHLHQGHVRFVLLAHCCTVATDGCSNVRHRLPKLVDVGRPTVELLFEARVFNLDTL